MLRCSSKVDVIFGNPQSIEKKNEEPPLPAHRQVVHKRAGAQDQVLISHNIAVPSSTIPRPNVVRYGPQPTMFEAEILVDETGKVIEVAETRNEELTKKMRDRFSKWKFRPLIIEGKAVRMRIKFPVSYFERLKRK